MSKASQKKKDRINAINALAIAKLNIEDVIMLNLKILKKGGHMFDLRAASKFIQNAEVKLRLSK